MVNFTELKKGLQKLSGNGVTISTIGKFNSVIGLEHFMVMEVCGEDALNLCNINSVLENGDSVNIVLDAESVQDFEISEVNDNKEVVVKWINGETMIVVGCGI